MLSYHLDITSDSSWQVVTPTMAAQQLPFYLTEIGKFTAGPRYYTQRSEKEGFFFLYTISGKGKLEMARETQMLVPGTLLLLSCHEFHRYNTLEAPWTFWWFHFSGTGAKGCFSFLDTPFFLSRYKFDNKSERSFPELFSLSGHSDLAAIARSSHIISRLFTEQLERIGQPGEKDGHGREDIWRAVAYIQDHFQEPLTIDRLAEEIRLSKYHLIRLFRRQMGTTPYQYLLHCRIDKAKNLLSSGNDSVESISAQVGFSDESHFISRFRAITGKTPAAYRGENIRYERLLFSEQKN